MTNFFYDKHYCKDCESWFNEPEYEPEYDGDGKRCGVSELCPYCGSIKFVDSEKMDDEVDEK